jgi:CRP-like cAMP-binding protein
MGRSDTNELVQVLSKLPAFAACSTQDLTELAARSHRSSLPARWPVIHEDTPADCCYILLDGNVAITVHGQEVATLGPGDVVGEVALARGKLRNAMVTSTSPLDLVHIDIDDFNELMERRPKLRAAMLARLDAEPTTA